MRVAAPICSWQISSPLPSLALRALIFLLAIVINHDLPGQDPIELKSFKTIPIGDKQGIASTIEFVNLDRQVVVAGTILPTLEVIDVVMARSVAQMRTDVGNEYKAYEWVRVSRNTKQVLVPISTEKVESVRRNGQTSQMVTKRGLIEVWNLDGTLHTKKLEVRDGFGLAAALAKLSPSGRYFACQEEPSYTAGEDRPQAQLIVWDTLSGDRRVVWNNAHAHCFTTDDQYVLINDDNNATAAERGLKVVEVATGNLVASKKSPDWQVGYTLGPVNYPHNVVAASLYPVRDTDWTIDLLNIDSLESSTARVVSGATSGAAEKYLYSVGFSGDGESFILGNSRSQLFVWNLTSRELSGPYSAVDYVLGLDTAISGNGQWLAYATSNADSPDAKALVHIVALTQGDRSRRFELPSGIYGDIAFSRNGTTLAVGGAGCIHLLDVSR